MDLGAVMVKALPRDQCSPRALMTRAVRWESPPTLSSPPTESFTASLSRQQLHVLFIRWLN